MTLLRDQINKSDMTNINVHIEAYEQMISFYQDFIERHGETEYITERLNYLYSQVAEYMIAREYAVESAYKRSLI